MKYGLYAIRCGLLGVMIFLFINTGCNVMQSLGGDNFTVWTASGIYEYIHSRGEQNGVRDHTRRLYKTSDLKSLKQIKKLNPDNPETMLDLLMAPNSPLLIYLREQIPQSGVERVRTHVKGNEPSKEKKEVLVAELNDLVQGPVLYNKERFVGIALDPETKRILIMRGHAKNEEFGNEFSKEELIEDKYSREVTQVDLNRMLLTDAFPDQIARIPHGSEIWPELPPHTKLIYYLGPGIKWGFLLGALAASIIVAVHRRRGTDLFDSSAQETFLVPWWISISLAGAGIFFHGYFLGLVAFVLAGHTKTRTLVLVLNRSVAFLVVLFWGLGTELWWGEGWSKMYPAVYEMLKGVV